jgi:hypothetical protein
LIISIIATGTICQDTPNLSLSQPHCCLDRPARGQASPEVVDFFLGLAIDLKRDRFVEREVRASVKAGKRLAVEFEADGHDRPDFPAVEFLAGLAVMGDGGDFCVIEDRTVELGGLFGLAVEPQARGDFCTCSMAGLLAGFCRLDYQRSQPDVGRACRRSSACCCLSV